MQIISQNSTHTNDDLTSENRSLEFAWLVYKQNAIAWKTGFLVIQCCQSTNASFSIEGDAVLFSCQVDAYLDFDYLRNVLGEPLKNILFNIGYHSVGWILSQILYLEWSRKILRKNLSWSSWGGRKNDLLLGVLIWIWKAERIVLLLFYVVEELKPRKTISKNYDLTIPVEKNFLLVTH